MTSYNQRGCFKCGCPFGGLYCRQCTCERCRRNYTGKKVCALYTCHEVEKSFVNDSNPNSLIDSPNIFNPPPQPQTYSCEFCGNNAHYGYDCPPQVPFIYNPEPCYNQDFDNDFPQNDDDVYFDIELDTGVFTKVVDDISNNSTRELYVHVPNVLPTLPTLSPMFDTLLPFSSENEDKVHLLSHRGFKAFQLFSESPMMIYGGNIPTLDVPIAPDYEASRARGFVLRSLELQSLA
ncbi:hypothetical protein Tco_0326813 [Tanacetum coccineum]